jgi:hypothetical protein
MIKMIKPVSAKGTKGFLISTKDGDHLFRVYDKDHNFVDYRIYINDVEIEITDDDAFFYKIDSKNILDYSPKTLGRDYDI